MAALLCTGTAAPSEAQSPPRPPVFSTALELVHLVVAVEDREGRPLADLRREDFVVREAGRRQEVEVCVRAGDDAQDRRLDVNVALLLDVSDSMWEKVNTSRLAAMGFLDAVPRAREMLVVLFHHQVRGFDYRPSDREATLKLIAETTPSGGTALYDAILAALERVRSASGREVLVLVTDGEDHKSQGTTVQVLEAVRRSRATVYPILVRNRISRETVETVAAQSFLERIARTSGGQLFEPEDAKGLPPIFDRLLRDLSSQYVLGFAPSSSRRDGAYRRLEVEVKRPSVKVRHKDGFFAPRGAP